MGLKGVYSQFKSWIIRNNKFATAGLALLLLAAVIIESQAPNSLKLPSRTTSTLADPTLQFFPYDVPLPTEVESEDIIYEDEYGSFILVEDPEPVEPDYGPDYEEEMAKAEAEARKEEEKEPDMPPEYDPDDLEDDF